MPTQPDNSIHKAVSAALADLIGGSNNSPAAVLASTAENLRYAASNRIEVEVIREECCLADVDDEEIDEESDDTDDDDQEDDGDQEHDGEEEDEEEDGDCDCDCDETDVDEGNDGVLLSLNACAAVDNYDIGDNAMVRLLTVHYPLDAPSPYPCVVECCLPGAEVEAEVANHVQLEDAIQKIIVAPAMLELLRIIVMKGV